MTRRRLRVSVDIVGTAYFAINLSARLTDRSLYYVDAYRVQLIIGRSYEQRFKWAHYTQIEQNMLQVSN